MHKVCDASKEQKPRYSGASHVLATSSAISSDSLPGSESDIVLMRPSYAPAAGPIKQQQQQQLPRQQQQPSHHTATNPGFGDIHAEANANASKAVLGALQALQHKVVTLEGERNRLEMKLAVSEVRFYPSLPPSDESRSQI